MAIFHFNQEASQQQGAFVGRHCTSYGEEVKQPQHEEAEALLLKLIEKVSDSDREVLSDSGKRQARVRLEALQLLLLAEGSGLQKVSDSGDIKGMKPTGSNSSKANGMSPVPDASRDSVATGEAPAGGIVARLKRLFRGGNR